MGSHATGIPPDARSLAGEGAPPHRPCSRARGAGRASWPSFLREGNEHSETRPPPIGSTPNRHVPQAPRLLDRVRSAIRARHYSRRTEKAYTGWIRRFILFHGKRHPLQMGAAEITAFLSDLAIRARVSASTQNQALSALFFLYLEVLGRQLDDLDRVVRARRPHRLPEVLTRGEVESLLRRLHGTPWLVGSLLYGSGLGCSRPCACG